MRGSFFEQGDYLCVDLSPNNIWFKLFAYHSRIPLERRLFLSLSRRKEMNNRSLSRRLFVSGVLAWAVGGCEIPLPTASDQDEGDPVAKLLGTSALRWQMPVYQSFVYQSRQPISPIGALAAARRKFKVGADGRVLSINGRSGWWVFAVGENLPPDYRIVSRGRTLVVESANNQGASGAGSVTPESVFAPAKGSKMVSITWHRVGVWKQIA